MCYISRKLPPKLSAISTIDNVTALASSALYTTEAYGSWRRPTSMQIWGKLRTRSTELVAFACFFTDEEFV